MKIHPCVARPALAISKTDEPQLTGVLVKLLDDQQDVRRAALIGLRTMTGSETPPAANGVQPAAFSASTDSGVDGTLGEQAEQWEAVVSLDAGRRAALTRAVVFARSTPDLSAGTVEDVKT